ncbi:hypothetical protein HJFPF1_04930 [Paramyrothecium foliicola]|nr:hypothetical protein HJFPF1_04930 [Paramyrothecium foliicola]
MASVATAPPALETLPAHTSTQARSAGPLSNLFKSLKLGVQSEPILPCHESIALSDAAVEEPCPKTPNNLKPMSEPSVHIKSANHDVALTPASTSTLTEAETPLKIEQAQTAVQDATVEKLLLQHAAALFKAQGPVPDSLPPLPKPVIIPRLNTEIISPLVRAWPPELAHHAVTLESFIALIDNINILSNPPASAIFLQLASIGIGFIPFEGADGLAALAELAAIGVSYQLIVTRCNNFLKQANQEYFHPRKLHARLVNTKKMMRSLVIPTDDPLIAPLVEDTLNMTAHERCMKHLETYSSVLCYDVPPSSPQTKVLEKIAAWNVERQRKKFEKCSKRSRKRAWKKYQAGKELKREGKQEKSRAKKLQWLLIQNLEDFQREEREDAEAEQQKRRDKELKRNFTIPWRLFDTKLAPSTRQESHETTAKESPDAGPRT